MTKAEKKKLAKLQYIVNEQKSIVSHERDLNSALRRYISDLKTRHDLAIDELGELAQGVGVKPSWYSEGHTWDAAMKNKAGNAVRKIAKMPLREAP